ncbi:MAG: molybdopterin-dependent oxidoreductase [Candidatus Binataceae bacterium]
MAKTVSITVDGRTLAAPEGATLLQVMLDAGIDIPHYCYHPKLSIDGSCRLCQVRIEGMPKLQISCNVQVRDGMIVHTDEPVVAQARRGALELLLVNHPLDCPICDKAGECWLQNYTMRYSSRHSSMLDPRRKEGKRLDIGERMLLDQERCILCRRCVRFCREISKTGELAVYHMGDRSQLDIYNDARLDNDYSMCTADICPVGALESKDFHHKVRVWYLQETRSVCPSCSNGCNIAISEYRNRIWRLTPRRNDAVNDTWMCDWGRLGYGFVNSEDRLRAPMVARDGALARVEWDEALAAAAGALAHFTNVNGGKALGALISPHLTNEENFRFGQLLRALGVEQAAMAVRQGKADKILIKADKAANARGVRELGLVSGEDDGLERLLKAAEEGRVKGLYVCGDDILDVADRARLMKILERLELLIVQGLWLRPEFAHATVILPGSTFAEKDGTFTNYAGRVQRIAKAITPPAGWLSDGEIFTRLMNGAAATQERFDLAAIWQSIASERAPFNQLSFDRIGETGEPLAGAGA